MKFNKECIVRLTVALLLFAFIGTDNAQGLDDLDHESLTIDVNFKKESENIDGISVIDGPIIIILHLSTFGSSRISGKTLLRKHL